ncbi:MAG: methionine--tRNA ligase [Vampirovibrionales bacterium]
MSRPFYLTTAIYYANGAPHIGHAYEVIAADVIARFNRLIGKQVFFLTGTDEHGIKVQKTALAQGTSPKTYVDDIAAVYRQEWAYLNVTHDRFIRTTDPEHYELVTRWWNKLVEKGDIYKAQYTGTYCPIREAFLTDRELKLMQDTGEDMSKLEAVTEENYFFRLSNYKDRVREFIETHETFILPAYRRNEVLNQLEDLADISVSRSKKSVSWGIPVPGDDEQVIYVWIDALSNYLTGLDWGVDDAAAKERFEEYWPPNVQVIGKDIMRFHAIYWPAMLMVADLPLPEHLLVHGFITVADTKISKSLGNVITPKDLVDRFELPNVDPIRYYFLATTPFGQDGSYTDDDFKAKVNADLANNLGNLLNRTLNMTKKYFDGAVPSFSKDYQGLIDISELNPIREHYDNYRFSEAMQSIMGFVDRANKYINEKEPWTLHKEEKLEQLGDVIYAILDSLRQVAILLYPVCPSLTKDLWAQLGFDRDLDQADWRWINGMLTPVGQHTRLGEPVLPRLESEIVGTGGKKK